MALLQDLEPPSSETKEDKIQQNKLNIITKLFLILGKVRLLPTVLNNFFSSVGNFIKSGRYIPHVALVLLGLIVAITNLSQKIAAKAYYSEIVTVNPDIQYSVAQSVDHFTPLIPNGSDSVEKAILVSTSSDGFISNAGAISTEVTNREEPPANADKTIQYVVNAGDTLSGLGMKFNVKIATLKYLNNIDNENMLKPGLKLTVPPANYEVSPALIAKREKEKQAKLAMASRNTVTRNSSSSRASGKAQTVNQTPGSSSNAYPYGWCTYYVATRRYVPGSWGNAKNWLSSAQRAGYSTGSEPAVGAIMVTSESGYGHVAYVESVDGDTITISEMNYKGWGVVDRRMLSANAGVIRGFVY